MLRRALLIIGIIIAIILIGVGIWAFFFAEDEAPIQVTERGLPVFPNSGTGGTNNPTPQKNENEEREPLIPRLRQISNVPVAGFTSFERDIPFTDGLTANPDGATTTTNPTLTIFRYVERATGHVYETTEKTLKTTRIINTTVPQAQNAIVGPTNSVVIQNTNQNNNNIETILINEKISTTTEEIRSIGDEEFGGGTEFESEFLLIDIPNITISPDGENFMYSLTSADGLALFQSPLSRLDTQLIYTSPFKSWDIDWLNNTTLQMTTKPDSQISGHTYTYNLETGIQNRVVGGFNGLTARISPDLNHTFYAHNNNGEASAFIINNTSRETVGMTFDTFADKCAWRPTSATSTVFCAAPSTVTGYNQPESWYQGRNSFEDSIWRVEAETGKTTLEMQSQSLHDKPFDIDMVQMSRDGEYYIFRDKRTGTLWSLDVKDQ